MKSWKTLRSQYVLERPWMSLRADRVQLPDGTELGEYHIVELPNWACVVCLTEAGDLVLVEQYRHGVQQMSLELPAGVIEGDERPEETARRELLEETGYVADTWRPLGQCATDPTKHNNYAHFFVAQGAHRRCAPSLDASEDIAVRLLHPADVLDLAANGAMIHGLHLAALFWAQHRGLLQKGP